MATISRCLFLLAFAVVPVLAQAPSPGGEPAFLALIQAPDPSGLAHQLNALGYDLAHDHPDGAVRIILSTEEEDALQNAGLFPMRVGVSRPLRDQQSGVDVLPGYRDLAGITAFLQGLATAHPGIVTFHDAASRWGPGATIEGRPIPVIKISDNAAIDENEPQVLFVSAHHCREIVTPEIAMDIADRLVNGYATDPNIRALVDRYEIWVAPIWNPDGLEYTWNSNNLWRKNRRDNGNGDFGVDLNRNYALGWDASCGGSTNTSSQTYRGPAPDSEPETQTMVAFSRARRFAKVMDYHSSGREVLLGYTCSNMPSSIDDLIVDEGTALSAAVATPPGYSTRRPSAEGEHQQFQMKEHTSYAFLTETQTQFQPSHADAMAEAAAVWPSAVAFLEREIPLVGTVTDSITGNPIEAQITVAGINWTQGETRFSEPRFGRYHLWLEAGTWDVTVQRPGYMPVTHTVTIVAGQSTIQDFALGQGFHLDFTTTGSGTGDFSIGLRGVPAWAVEGYTLFSLTPGQPQGSGALLGLVPDVLTLTSLTYPATVGSPIHWLLPAPSQAFPHTPFMAGAGAVPFPPGTVVEGVAVALAAGFTNYSTTEIVQATF